MNQMLSTERNRGIALISVLWVVALLAVVAGGMSAGMQNETRLARNLIASAQARHAAEGGVHAAIGALVNSTGPSTWRADRSLHELALGDAVVRIAVSDESGKIDLNAAQDRLLDGLLKTVGVADWERPNIVDAILDWRDADSVTHLNGAEDSDYRAAEKRYGSKDSRFESVEELQLVLGLSPELYRKIKPALTVYSGRAGVNPAAASRLVLLAIPGVNAETVDRYMDSREQNLVEGPPPRLPLVDQRYLSSSTGTTYSIHAQARMQSGVTAHITATVKLRGTTDAPVKILSWTEEGDELFPRVRTDT